MGEKKEEMKIDIEKEKVVDVDPIMALKFLNIYANLIMKCYQHKTVYI